MIKQILKILLFCTVAFLPAACELSTDDYNEGDFFYIRNKGSDMPVWVCGNENSRAFIIYIAGGPGDSALLEHYSKAMIKIEENYRVAYYDQRGAGNSIGSSSKKDFTVEQFVQDLDVIVNAISIKYNSPEIFLLGHSWGGCLGTAYLIDPERQSKIRGWIEVDGAHNWKKGEVLAREYVMQYAREHSTKKNGERPLSGMRKILLLTVEIL